MGDSINIDWGSVQPQPSPFNAFMQGAATARAMNLLKQEDQARNAALANPSDLDAVTRLAVFNPDAAKPLQQRIVGNAAANALTANAFAAPTMGAPAPGTPAGQSSFAPSGLPAVQPGSSFAQAFAPVAQGQLAQTAPAPAAAQVAPDQLVNAQAPHMQAIGAAATQGQMDPTKALATLAQVGGPEAVSSMVQSLGQMDTLRRTRLADMNDALGTVAQTLLNTPQSQRAAVLTQAAPYLAQHGVTTDQINQAISGGLTDQQLHGFVGQAVGVSALIAQANKEREFGQTDRQIGIQQQNANTQAGALAETSRHNQVEEGKPVVAGFGSSAWDPHTRTWGTPGSDAGDVNSRIMALEGTGNNPVSSASGPGQFTNATFRQMVGQVSPGIAQQIAGMSDAQLTQWRRSNAATLAPIQQQMVPILTQANQAALTNAGLTASDGNTYMAHVFGAGGAVAALKANPNAQAAQYVGGSKALTNNGLPANATVAQVQAWAANKMAGVAGSSTSVGGLDAPTIRRLAEDAVNAGSLTALPGQARNPAAVSAINNAITRVRAERGLGSGDVLATKAGLHADTAGLAALEKQATLVSAAERAAQANGQLALSLAPAVGNGNIQVFNAWKNHWNTSMGDPAVAKFASALSTFSNEYATVMGRGTPTESLRAEAHDNINKAQSPQQLAGVIAVMQQDMANRNAGFAQERQATLGRISGDNPAPATVSTGKLVMGKDGVMEYHP